MARAGAAMTGPAAAGVTVRAAENAVPAAMTAGRAVAVAPAGMAPAAASAVGRAAAVAR